MPTILHVAQSSEGGVATFVADLAGAQRAAGHRVAVACVPDSRLAHAAARAGADVIAWQAVGAPGRTVPAEVAAVTRIVRTVRPDLVHLHSSKAGLAGRLALRGHLPTVFQPHAWSFFATGPGPLYRATVRWERLAARWAHQVVCVSEAERADGEAAGVRARCTVVPNGVDLDHYRAAPVAERRAARARLGLDARTPLAVCIGRLHRQKGQDVLLEAWPGIARTVPDARLALVGDGPARDRLRQRATADVLFAGDVADPRDWYLAADLVVLPSRWEGMALAPLEAMACACPVVVSDVPGAREALPAGHAATNLVPPEDPAALAGAVAALLSDREACRTLGGQARTHVCARHGFGRVVDDIRGVYREAHRVWRTAAR
ncbi:glycosyltransferase [Streptomyces sp. XM83C]|jgi:glycosyltransferase involved in cell wall biosynthesis|uniref:Glycosyltransferase n=1 Tax=Streptomyces thermocoprophilus TaxID=78356 RepID=A0ABV5V7Z7_9ACTN|nr:glycosyltransferase [Streptomyces sp. XM83C]MCK1822550.1 glycosyltransferase [Streptomyces sp. XM83C]